MAYPEIPHLKWPLQHVGGMLLAVEQDTIDDVEQCVHVLLSTPLGSRPLAPQVGAVDPTFTGVDAGDLEARLTDPETGEPRAKVDVTVTGHGPEQTVDVQVQLAETT